MIIVNLLIWLDKVQFLVFFSCASLRKNVLALEIVFSDTCISVLELYSENKE